MKWLKYWLEGLIVINLMVLTTVTFLQVLFRFVFQYPAFWTTEVVSFSFIFVVFLGAALAVKKNTHITVDLVENLPISIQRVIFVIGQALILLFLVVLTYYGWQHSMKAMTQLTPALQIPKGYVYLVAPFSSILMIYYLIRSYFQSGGESK